MKTTVLLGLIILSYTSLLQVRGHGDEGAMTITDRYSNEGCDTGERGCFDCESCEVNMSWEPKPNDNKVRFNLWGPLSGNTGYIAIGISLDNKMPSSDIYACVVNSGAGELQRYWSPGRSVNRRSPLKGVSNMTVELVDNMIRCDFTRDMLLNDGDAEFYDISGNNQYHILLASEGGLSSSGEITYHTPNRRTFTDDPVLLSEVSSTSQGTEDVSLMQVHGCLMIIAWIGLASIGITLARYFKPMWPNSTLCGVKIWFAIHRTCMVTALVSFLVAFIIIFVHVGGFVSNADMIRYVHGIFGIIVTILGVVNPIMALFRPHPGTPNRPIFDWAHWGVGTLAHLLAIVTIFLALAENTLIPNLKTYTFWVMVGFLIFHIVMWGLFEIQRCLADSAGRSDDIPLGGKGEPPNNQAPDDTPNPSGAVCKMLLLFIYSLGVIFVVAFLIITIALASSDQESQ